MLLCPPGCSDSRSITTPTHILCVTLGLKPGLHEPISSSGKCESTTHLTRSLRTQCPTTVIIFIALTSPDGAEQKIEHISFLPSASSPLCEVWSIGSIPLFPRWGYRGPKRGSFAQGPTMERPFGPPCHRPCPRCLHPTPSPTTDKSPVHWALYVCPGPSCGWSGMRCLGILVEWHLPTLSPLEPLASRLELRPCQRLHLPGEPLRPCSALQNASIHCLKKTCEKVSRWVDLSL